MYDLTFDAYCSTFSIYCIAILYVLKYACTSIVKRGLFMDRTGKFLISFIIVAVVCCVVRMDYLHTRKLEMQLGTVYQRYVDTYEGKSYKWTNIIEGNELNYDNLKDMSATISSYDGLYDQMSIALPHTLELYQFCFSGIRYNIIDKLLANKGNLNSFENKQMVKKLDNYLNKLHNSMQIIDTNCGSDPVKYYKELSNDKSKTNDQLLTTLIDLNLEISSIKK